MIPTSKALAASKLAAAAISSSPFCLVRTIGDLHIIDIASRQEYSPLDVPPPRSYSWQFSPNLVTGLSLRRRGMEKIHYQESDDESEGKTRE